MSKAPNILLITSDQQRGDCYGFERPEIKTPHLDRLARDGTRFSACITPNPSAARARADGVRRWHASDARLQRA